MDDEYMNKYLRYKAKYLALKEQKAGLGGTLKRGIYIYLFTHTDEIYMGLQLDKIPNSNYLKVSKINGILTGLAHEVNVGGSKAILISTTGEQIADVTGRVLSSSVDVANKGVEVASLAASKTASAARNLFAKIGALRNNNQADVPEYVDQDQEEEQQGGYVNNDKEIDLGFVVEDYEDSTIGNIIATLNNQVLVKYDSAIVVEINNSKSNRLLKVVLNGKTQAATPIARPTLAVSRPRQPTRVLAPILTQTPVQNVTGIPSRPTPARSPVAARPVAARPVTRSPVAARPVTRSPVAARPAVRSVAAKPVARSPSPVAKPVARSPNPVAKPVARSPSPSVKPVQKTYGLKSKQTNQIDKDGKKVLPPLLSRGRSPTSSTKSSRSSSTSSVKSTGSKSSVKSTGSKRSTGSKSSTSTNKSKSSTVKRAAKKATPKGIKKIKKSKIAKK